jgi:integrase
VDKEKDNYIDKNDFVFNAYKTSKNGSIQQRVPIPKTLKALLNKAIKVNKYDYLLVSTTGEKLSSIIITQRLNKLFGSKTSTSMLRHIYLSNVYKDVPALKEMKELADNMGHDVSTALQYVKK